MVEMTPEAFEEAVADALDAIPEQLAEAMSNIVVLVAAEPPDDVPADLLGLYDGVPLTERDAGWDTFAVPDRITLFRGPTLRACASTEEVVREVAVTVVHEVAHHFGIDDGRLADLGWS